MGQVFCQAAVGHHHLAGKGSLGIGQDAGHRYKSGSKKRRQVEVFKGLFNRDGHIFQKPPYLTGGIGFDNQAFNGPRAVHLQTQAVFSFEAGCNQAGP